MRVPASAAFASLLAALGAAGCTTSLRPGPDLGSLYNTAAQAGDQHRNPIIVIPGVLGTVLRDTDSGRVGAELAELHDEVAPDGVLESVTVSLLGLPVEQHAYISILRTLGAGGYRDQQLGEAGAIDYGGEHFTCFQFSR